MTNAVARFTASMVINYEKWHDGIGYDLDAIRDAMETLDYQGAVTHWRFTPSDHTGQAKSEALQTARIENGAMKVVFRSEA